MKHPRGRIAPEYWVSCGLCGQERPCSERTKAEAVKTIEAQGYQYSDSHGWICPECCKRID
jgi:hypothetical protein